jgi:hypothetical protein
LNNFGGSVPNDFASGGEGFALRRVCPRRNSPEVFATEKLALVEFTPEGFVPEALTQEGFALEGLARKGFVP